MVRSPSPYNLFRICDTARAKACQNISRTKKFLVNDVMSPVEGQLSTFIEVNPMEISIVSIPLKARDIKFSYG